MVRLGQLETVSIALSNYRDQLMNLTLSHPCCLGWDAQIVCS